MTATPALRSKIVVRSFSNLSRESTTMHDPSWHPLVDGVPPPWATGWGQDDCGVFVEFEIQMVTQRMVKASAYPIRLGGIGQALGRQIERRSGLETRVSVLGHIQRGGSPTPEDRNLGTLFGKRAVELIQQGKIGFMASLKNGKISSVPIRTAIRKRKLVSRTHPLLLAARAVGTSFGN